MWLWVLSCKLQFFVFSHSKLLWLRRLKFLQGTNFPMFKPSKKTMQLKESENIFKFSKNGTL